MYVCAIVQDVKDSLISCYELCAVCQRTYALGSDLPHATHLPIRSTLSSHLHQHYLLGCFHWWDTPCAESGSSQIMNICRKANLGELALIYTTVL
ncbi:hypothetical protein C8Q74DRAFT_1249933 [Fomes fomentarius]|nr:hypothetical protein C8Q74DRAFT_1249933 [Fomes fomentarius]